jgi:hypothetical protein
MPGFAGHFLFYIIALRVINAVFGKTRYLSCTISLQANPTP